MVFDTKSIMHNELFHGRDFEELGYLKRTSLIKIEDKVSSIFEVRKRMIGLVCVKDNMKTQIILLQHHSSTK